MTHIAGVVIFGYCWLKSGIKIGINEKPVLHSFHEQRERTQNNKTICNCNNTKINIIIGALLKIDKIILFFSVTGSVSIS